MIATRRRMRYLPANAPLLYTYTASQGASINDSGQWYFVGGGTLALNEGWNAAGQARYFTRGLLSMNVRAGITALAPIAPWAFLEGEISAANGQNIATAFTICLPGNGSFAGVQVQQAGGFQFRRYGDETGFVTIAGTPNSFFTFRIERTDKIFSFWCNGSLVLDAVDLIQNSVMENYQATAETAYGGMIWDPARVGVTLPGNGSGTRLSVRRLQYGKIN